MAGFSTLAQANSDHFNSIAWVEIKTPNNVPLPLSIAVSPVTHDFVALASDDEGEATGAYYFLDHTNFAAGWQKRGTFLEPCSPCRILYGADRFIVTFFKKGDLGELSQDCRIFSSIDNGSTWTQSKQYFGYFNNQPVTPIYVHNGSWAHHEVDDNDYFFALKGPSEKTRFVMIGGLAFTTQEIYYSKQDLDVPLDAWNYGTTRPRGPHGIVAFAGDEENGWVGLGSDGTSYFGTSTKPVAVPPAANQ